jgi:TolB-like protein/tetratricopeptide (TPR) repeat protein
MSFVAELKQRKVFRVATVYLVVAWVAVQAASIALPAFDAPAWVLRVVILLIALGFPFALVLAWALDVTPDGLRFSAGGVGAKRIAVIAAALVVLALVWYFRGQPALRLVDTAGTTPAVPAVDATATARSIAVLPFVNMNKDPANDYFSDGLAETTLDMLAQVPNLKVVARTSSFAFKGRSDDVRKIGAALGAATLLEGSVQRAGDAVRITTQLVKTSDGTHLWSKHFDRQLADVFKIQDEVATEVVRALEVSLPASDQQRLTQKRTDNFEAYQEYLKGTALMPGRKVDDMRAAAAHFEKAIAIDGNYARAYVAAADAYQLIAEYAGVAPTEKAHVGTYIERALVLAPDLGEAHASRGTQLQNAHDFEGAEREFRRATELAPSYASAFQWYGELLCYILHDFPTSERMLRHAVTLDPLSPIVQDQLIYPLIAANRLDSAKIELDKLLREHPDFAQGYYTQARFAAAQGDLVAALRGFAEHAARDPAALSRIGDRCFLLERFSAIEPARACLRDLLTRSPDSVELATELAQLELLGSDAAKVLAQVRSGMRVDKGFEAFLLVCVGRVDEALAILRVVWPQQFASPAPKPYPGVVQHSVLVGAALLRSGATAQGRALLLGVTAELAARPISGASANFAWWDAVAFELLGERERAIVALERGVEAGAILDIWDLDADPLLAGLRADPRFAKILAPARARAAAQVAAAQAAGLL